MVSLEEKRNVKYSPGDIIYVDSNFSERYDCFGVVIDRNFWMEQVKKENVYLEDIERLKKNGVWEKHIPFRVLGTKAFRQWWKANNSGEIEPNEEVIMNYRCQAAGYVTLVNLRPLIEISEKDNGRVGKLLFTSSFLYTRDALEDAKTVYDYFDGKRFEPSKNEKYVFKEDKLLRLLEQAVPL